jgi:hypothetical protein
MCFPVKILRYLIFAPYAHGRRMLIVLLAFSVLPPAARADLSLLRDEIVAFNLEEHKKALADGSYRGEAGILRIGPEVALSLGLQAWMGKDYKDARAFYEEADKYYEAAVEAMVTDRAEKYKG